MFTVQFKYPSAWVPDFGGYDAGDEDIAEQYRDERGRDYGYFAISAINAPDSSVDDVARREAALRLRPFGENSQIVSLVVSERDARLVLPEEVAPASEPFVAALFVSYASPIAIGGSTFNFLAVYGHKDFVRAISRHFADGLRFAK